MTGLKAAELDLHSELHCEWAKLACVVKSLRAIYDADMQLPKADDAVVWGALHVLEDHILPRLYELQEVAESFISRGEA